MGQLKERVNAYRKACQKAVDFQISFLQPDGGYIWEGYPSDAFHKQPYAWQLLGRTSEAERLLNWVKANKLEPDGQLTGFNGDMYKHNWLFKGAHKLGRFDISYPLMNYILSCQAPCGGFPHFAGDKLTRSLATSWAGVSMLYNGDMDNAEKIAKCCISMIEQQPDENKFYFKTTFDGKLMTDANNPDTEYIDTTKTKQCYWEVGFIMIFFCRMYQATGEQKYLDYTKGLLDFMLRCREDNYEYWGSGKSALGSALYYSLTGDERGKEAALRFCEFVVRTQRAEGGFQYEDEPDELIIYVDHAACFTVWVGETIMVLEGVDGIS